MKQITLEALKEVLRYEPETGNFIWLVSGARNLAGSVAGCVCGRYITIGVLGIKTRAHRLAWFWNYGKWPVHGVDHINGNRFDNRIENLRDVPQRINNQNWRKARRDSVCGLAGVKMGEHAWIASINSNGKKIHLGSFQTKEDAHAAYVKAKRIYHEGCVI